MAFQRPFSSSLCLVIYCHNRWEFSLVNCLYLIACLAALYIAKTFSLVTHNSCSFHNVNISICFSKRLPPTYNLVFYLLHGLQVQAYQTISMDYGLSLPSFLFFLEIHTQTQKHIIHWW